MAAITPVSLASVRPIAGQGITVRKIVGATIDAGMGCILQSDGFVDPSAVNSTLFIGIVCATNGQYDDIAVGQTVDVCVFGRVGGFSGLTPGAAVYLAASGALADTDGGKLIGYCFDEESIFITRSYTTDVS